MNDKDREIFSQGLRLIGQRNVAPRYYAESDGEPHARTHYVVHTTRLFRRDCSTWNEAKQLAAKLNEPAH